MNTKNYISVEAFAKLHNMTAENVIDQIRIGSYQGEIVKGEWFVSKNQPTKTTKTTKSNTNEKEYKTTSALASFISFIGWLIVVGSGLGCVVGYSSGANIMIIFVALGFAVTGFLIIMVGQITHATITTANNTTELVMLMKNDKQ